METPVSKNPVQLEEEAGVPLRLEYEENRLRLSRLAGRDCPNCRRVVYFDGKRLWCSDYLSRSGQSCFYTWDNALSAEDDILCGFH